ncbi:MAG: hypothetical protein HYU25_06420 [Candidatus Rokubacteria bacterium]|jgi:hypothetical protein|nr:hypothetical protein [Candidatus Rokubacteria bacterium]
MKLRLMLAHAAEVQAGMLYMLGTGWTEIGPAPSPFAIAGIIEVPWDETNWRRKLEIPIEDEDGQPLVVATPAGDQLVKFQADFDVGRPPGVAPGRSFNLPIAINIVPLPLQAGRHYVVKAFIDGELADEVGFSVRQQPGVGQQPPR